MPSWPEPDRAVLSSGDGFGSPGVGRSESVTWSEWNGPGERREGRHEVVMRSSTSTPDDRPARPAVSTSLESPR